MNQFYLCSREQAHYQQLFAAARLPNLQLTEDISAANIILGDPPLIAPKIAKASALQWLQSTFAGVDRLIAAPKRDYQLTNVRGIFGALMAEYVFGQLLFRQRDFAHYQQLQQQHCWQPKAYQPLSELTLCLLGTGAIGQHLAMTAAQFSMRVIGVNRTGNIASNCEHSATGKNQSPFAAIYTSAQIKTALSQADVVVATLPATAQTTGLLSRDALSACQNALLFNLGRANLLAEADVLWALERHHISHAFLDVFAHEPLPSTHPFWAHSAISITPHIAAVSFPEQVWQIFAANYLRWINQQPLAAKVDFARGY